MRRSLCALAFSFAAASVPPAFAQEPDAVYQTQPQKQFQFAGDLLGRYEWTKDIADGAGGTSDEKRWRLQARPRVQATVGPLELGVGGAFNYSQDKNDDYASQTSPLVRDNYRSRDARLDLAWAKLKLGPLVARGGRFVMPIAFTEMIWDRDLRPQGGAASLEIGGSGGGTRFALTGLYAKGSHVFEDQSVMLGGAAELKLVSTSSAGTSLQLVGSYLDFRDLDRLEPAIRRQNTRVAGLIVNPYRVVDVVARLSYGQQVPVTLVADYCWNTALSANNHGLWLAAVLGSLETSRSRLEYTFAKVDRDATLAAFNADDFLWGTGWVGHRVDLGTSARAKTSVHAIAQWQRFKDSANAQVREQWVKRYRLEWHASF